MAGKAFSLPPTAQRLVALLALCGRSVLRLQAAATLWGDISEPNANARLRSTLWRLRRIARPVVVAEGGMLSLAPGLTVDLQERVACARRILEGSTTYHETDLAELIADGDLLADWYEDWLIIDRERLRQLRLHALEALGGRLLADRKFGHAVEAGLAAVNSEPLRESAQRLLISAHLAEGNAADALRQYDRYSVLLGRELGLTPSAQLTGLVRGLRRVRRFEARRASPHRQVAETLTDLRS